MTDNSIDPKTYSYGTVTHERGHYRFRASVNGRRLHLGCFDTYEAACEARTAWNVNPLDYLAARPQSTASKQILGPVTPPLEPVPEGYALTKIKTQVDASGAVRGQSLSAKPAPVETEAVPEGHVERGRSTLLASDGTVIAQWIKTAKGADVVKAFDALTRELPARVPPRPPVSPDAPEAYSEDLLAVYPIGDPHIGLRNRDGYGTAEACATLGRVFADLVHRGPRAESCIVAALGDTVHSDDPRNRTRRHGHVLDVDGDWFENLKATRDVLIECVETALRHHRFVHVKCLIGNHDDLSSAFFALLLDALYRDEKRVTVDTDYEAHLWFEFGSCLLGFHHGHQTKPADLPAVMANRVREAWGRSTHAYWYLGHVHHTRRVEIGGCVIESFRTLAAQDTYSKSSGYVSGRDLNRIVLHREKGEVSREVCSVY